MSAPTTAEVREAAARASKAQHDAFSSGDVVAEFSSSGRAGALERFALPLAEERDALAAALAKIDAIRNSIVGRQGVNWSDHIYPLVAALNEAGYGGEGYAVARPKAEAERAAYVAVFEERDAERARADAAEAEVGRLRAVARRVAAAAEALEDIVDSSRGYTGDSIEWESDSTLGPKWQAWRNWAYDAIKAAKGESQ